MKGDLVMPTVQREVLSLPQSVWFVLVIHYYSLYCATHYEC